MATCTDTSVRQHRPMVGQPVHDRKMNGHDHRLRYARRLHPQNGEGLLDPYLVGGIRPNFTQAIRGSDSLPIREELK